MSAFLPADKLWGRMRICFQEIGRGWACEVPCHVVDDTDG